MTVDIALVLIFVASISFVIYKASIKVPALILIPDETISERLRSDSAPILKKLMRLRDLYRAKELQVAFWKVVGKILYRLHIALMKIDNAVVRRLKKIRGENGSANGSGNILNNILNGKEPE